MPVQLAQRLISVAEYLKMADAGILTEVDRVELIRGQIIEMSPIGSRHAACVDKIVALFHRLLTPNTAIVRGQNPIQLDDYSEPEPDVAILQPDPDYYSGQHPRAGDILLIVEVADSSYEYDRQVKLVPRELNILSVSRLIFPPGVVARRSRSFGYAPSSRLAWRETKLPKLSSYLVPEALALYAAAGIPEYWIINLDKKEIEAFRDPVGDLYKQMEIYLPGEEVTFRSLTLSAPAEAMLV